MINFLATDDCPLVINYLILDD